MLFRLVAMAILVENKFCRSYLVWWLFIAQMLNEFEPDRWGLVKCLVKLFVESISFNFGLIACVDSMALT